MPWFKKICFREICVDVLCGGGLGLVKGAFGVLIFTESETEKIYSLKQLALSVMTKAPKIATDPVICEGVRNGQKFALEAFTKGLSSEAVAVRVGTAAELVCNKSFLKRFTGVLTGACMNIINC
jgi:hypothetical protein